MRDAETVARLTAKAQAHITAFRALYSLPYTVDFPPVSATILTLDVGAQGDLVVTLTWAVGGVVQDRPDGGVQTWIVTNPPLYVPDPRGTVKVGGVKCRLDPLYIAKAELGALLAQWAALP